MANKRPVLLVGSVAMNSTTEVFERVAGALGNSARRIPDGETGVRRDWIGWQGAVFGKAAGLEVAGTRPVPGGEPFTIYRAKPGASTGDIKMGALGYAAVAEESYREFTRLRAAGKIPAGVRFEVCLPTPLAPVAGFIDSGDVTRVWPAYERHIIEETTGICRAIPHRDLAIQWDIAVEMVALEAAKAGVPGPFPAGVTIKEMADSIARVTNNVPADVEVGLHFCYGDRGHKHMIEPSDSSLMVELSNLCTAAITRPITWIHMPVPRDRDDDAYYAPLKNLKLNPGTEFYLGLVHRTGGIEGNRRRVAAASKVVKDFGVATECGLARRPADTMDDVLALHRTVAEL